MNEKQFAITHYHWDHYNFISLVPRIFLISYMFLLYLLLLTLEKPSLKILCLFIITKFRNYPLIPLLLKSTKEIQALHRGDTFYAGDIRWEVLWPDYHILDQFMRRKLENLRKRIDNIKNQLDSRQQRAFNIIYNVLSGAFSDSIEVMWFNNYLEEDYLDVEREGLPSSLIRAVGELEKEFKKLTNSASLIFSSKEYPHMLFLGDASDLALNIRCAKPDLREIPFFLIKAAHHGTHYGNILDGVKTKFLVFSRNKILKPRDEYFTNIDWYSIIDTHKHGSCLISET